jgi:hypothetical protein
MEPVTHRAVWARAGDVARGGRNVPRDTLDTGVLEFLANAAQARAASYRDKAARLRAMAEAEPIGKFRERLLDLSRQFEALADTLETKRRRV